MASPDQQRVRIDFESIEQIQEFCQSLNDMVLAAEVVARQPDQHLASCKIGFGTVGSRCTCGLPALRTALGVTGHA